MDDEFKISTFSDNLVISPKWLHEQFESQNARNHQIIIGVVVAAVLILIAVAVEIMIFHTNQNNSLLDRGEYYRDIEALETQIKSLQDYHAN